MALLAAGGIMQQCWGDERVNERIEVHFQKLVFNVPDDKFYVGFFDQRTGEISWEREYDRPPTTGLVQKVSESTGVLVQRISDAVPKYSSRLVDLNAREVLLDLGFDGSWGVFKKDFYFVEGGELKQFNFRSKQVAVLEKGVTAVAASADRLVKFILDGKILITGGSADEPPASFKGLVSNAGSLTNGWVWYFLRRNEKSSGDLWVLNVYTQEQHKIEKKLPQCRLVMTR